MYYYGLMFDFSVTSQMLSTDCDRRQLITLIAGRRLQHSREATAASQERMVVALLVGQLFIAVKIFILQ